MTDVSPTVIGAQIVADRLRAGARATQEISQQFVHSLAELKKAGNLTETCRAYKALKDAYEFLDSERKEVYKTLEEMSRSVIPEMLEEAEVSNITLDYGDGLKYRFGKNQRLTASVLDKDAAMAWLTANGGEGLIQPTINSSSLSSFAKEYVGTQGKDLPADVFKVGTMIVTSITKA